MTRRGGIAPRPQLLTYANSLGGDLGALRGLLSGPLNGLFHGVHVLPPFPSTGDRGFAPIGYDRIDEQFGTWADIEAIASDYDVLLDVMVNHISRQSDEFQEFIADGRDASSADLFITLDKVWPDLPANREPPPEHVAKLALRKPGGPFTTIIVERTGVSERIWTSFGTADWSEQIDLDLRSDAARALITSWLATLAGHGVRIVRLDAVGYVTKRAGTNCFMVEPDIYDVLEWIEGVAHGLGLTLLPEVHDRYETHERLSERGYWTYDFVLPALVLHAFARGDGKLLADHLARSPHRQVTTLDCHDGIPVRPDLDGLIAQDTMRDLTDQIVVAGGNVSRILSPVADGEVDVHQLNCTYYSAIGECDDRYAAARAIQLFARGVPQLYYVGLLAGANDHEAVERTGEGRAINRHDYSSDEVLGELRRPVVQRVLDLVRLRNTHPAFDGELTVDASSASRLRMHWQHDDAVAGPSACTLDVDLATGVYSVDTGG